MFEQPTWPPPPDVPDPLAAHDEFLVSLLRAPLTKPPMSRGQMYRALHRETGLDLRQCMAVVNSFCDRRGVFPQRRGLRLWLAVLPSLIQMGAVTSLLIMQTILGREFAAAHTRAARRLILQNRIQWDYTLLGLILLACVASILTVVTSSKWARREAEEARRRVQAGDFSPNP